MKRISCLWFLFPAIFLHACNSSSSGCTDPLANNLDPEASENDGSCTYDEIWIQAQRSMPLSENLAGTSGLLFWEGRLWTHNDHDDTRLYALDTADAGIEEEFLLEGVENTNWEDIDHDSDYIYVGDFGNNAAGNREDLHILRIQKSSLLMGSPSIDTIWFSYSNQGSLNPVGPNQTEFDCEAMVATADHIYLFSKQWTSGHTTLYRLPKHPGTQVAEKLATLDVQGLISGACLLESKHILVLCGYTGILQPFLYLLYDYPEDSYFMGNKRRVNISIPFLQVEGISSPDGLTFYLSNESYVMEPVTNTLQQLHIIDLRPFMEEYLQATP